MWNDLRSVQSYCHNSELQRHWAWELLATQSFQGSERLLDFGCGDGKITAELSRLLPDGEVTGIDLSAAMIDFASRRFPRQLYPNLSYRLSEAPSADEPYDLICSFCVFHLLPDPTAVVANLKSRLAKSGRLLAVYPGGEHLIFNQAAQETFAHFGRPAFSRDPKRCAIWSLEGSAEIFSAAGWEVDHLAICDTPYAFYDHEEFLAWFLGTCVPAWEIPDQEARPFFSHLIDRLAVHDPNLLQSDGSYHFSFSRIHAIAHSA